jgi:drug/metabolite transporter (DMT)-like permease
MMHAAVFLWGFTAILGRLISINALALVWHRLWITCLVLLFLPSVRKGLGRLGSSSWLRFSGIGLVVTAHWLCFYGAIKLANISVALVTLATGPLFAAFIEPVLFNIRLRFRQLFTGILSAIGIYIIFREIPTFSAGLLTGIAAAGLSALFSTLNKKYLQHNPAAVVSWVELAAGWLALTPLMLLNNNTTRIPHGMDFLWLFLLGAGCTALPFIISLRALRHLSAFTSTLLVNLEPVYGLVLAALIFGEHRTLSASFYLGSLLIIGSVMIAPISEKPKHSEQDTVRS